LEGTVRLLKGDELGGDRLRLLARRFVLVGPACQPVHRADKGLTRLAQPRVVVAISRRTPATLGSAHHATGKEKSWYGVENPD
jgi:hypothetical protein